MMRVSTISYFDMPFLFFFFPSKTLKQVWPGQRYSRYLYNFFPMCIESRARFNDYSSGPELLHENPLENGSLYQLEECNL